MKRIISLILILSMVMSFAACSKSKDDNEQITMYIGLGNTNSSYYTQIHQLIEDELGIDVKYIYNNTADTTNSLVDRVRNDDLPADIIISASLMPEDVQKSAFLDCSTETNLPDLFTSSEISQISIDGSVYQLPFSSRIIGITYNKTLFEELGWELPSNFSQMVELKAKADAAGIKFSVTPGALTGHGFSYLFDLMGSEFIYTLDGTSWYENFHQGSANSDELKSAAEYFKQFYEAGLFGNFHYGDWGATGEFKETRALFYINYINDAYSYDGFQYDDEGKIVGATYVDGEVVATKSDDGNAVLVDDKYVLYDESNEDYKDLQRYEIAGAKVLHDKYGSMPWISSEGKGNFVIFNNVYIALNKSLGEDREKLDKVIKILELLTEQKACDIYTNLFPDGFVSTKGFSIDSTRLYYDYKDVIEEGCVEPRYYDDFDVDSIVNVGQKVNEYLAGVNGTTFDDIFTELEYRKTEALNNNIEYCATISENLSYEDSAKLQCVANALSAQGALETNKKNINVSVSILPYVDTIADLPLEVQTPIVQQKFYKGKVETAVINQYVQPTTSKPVIAKMTGTEIKALIDAGYNTKDDYDYDMKFDLAVVVKGDAEILDNKTCYVVIPEKVLTAKIYEEYKKAGKIVLNDKNEPITGNTQEGLMMFFDNMHNGKISSSLIKWN